MRIIIFIILKLVELTGAVLSYMAITFITYSIITWFGGDAPIPWYHFCYFLMGTSIIALLVLCSMLLIVPILELIETNLRWSKQLTNRWLNRKYNKHNDI